MTESTIQNIEKIVCESVNEVVEASKYGYHTLADPKSMYIGKTKVPMRVLIARQMVYMVLHDMYGVPYSTIMKRCGISRRRILSGIFKARSLSITDSLYKDVRERICLKITPK